MKSAVLVIPTQGVVAGALTHETSDETATQPGLAQSQLAPKAAVNDNKHSPMAAECCSASAERVADVGMGTSPISVAEPAVAVQDLSRMARDAVTSPAACNISNHAEIQAVAAAAGDTVGDAEGRPQQVVCATSETQPGTD